MPRTKYKIYYLRNIDGFKKKEINCDFEKYQLQSKIFPHIRWTLVRIGNYQFLDELGGTKTYNYSGKPILALVRAFKIQSSSFLLAKELVSVKL